MSLREGLYSFRKPGDAERMQRFEKIHWWFFAAKGANAFVLGMFLLVNSPHVYKESTHTGIKGSFVAERFDCIETQQSQNTCSWQGMFRSTDRSESRSAHMQSGPVFKGDVVTAYDVGDSDQVYLTAKDDKSWIAYAMLTLFFLHSVYFAFSTASNVSRKLMQRRPRGESSTSHIHGRTTDDIHPRETGMQGQTVARITPISRMGKCQRRHRCCPIYSYPLQISSNRPTRSHRRPVGSQGGGI